MTPLQLIACPVSAAAVAAAEPLLSPTERARAETQAVARRTTWTIGRALLRQTLSTVLNCSATDIAFRRGARGKLELAQPRAINAPAFNLSHTAEWVVVALGASGAVGVDIDQAGRELDPLRIARRYFSTAEVTWLQQLTPAEQREQFMVLWTFKEAFVKALGCGIAGGLSRTAFAVASNESLQLQADAGWSGPVSGWQWRIPGELGVSWLALIALAPCNAAVTPSLQLAQPRADAGFDTLPWSSPQLSRTLDRPSAEE
ncbi:MAG: 4'-phosphopantetheinyl transferase superfamily protein [Spongiibacteraceae bacterium]|nr:4'-phosphopantetheinyl transferase superfamily protein [Spongiibacteraceae bacterium]